jgi:hypothetical protein
LIGSLSNLYLEVNDLLLNNRYNFFANLSYLVVCG